MNSHEVVVVDYGVGNLLSIERALEFCGARVKLTSKAEDILSAKRVILPGVGAFSNAMRSIIDLGLISPLRQLADLKIPTLGICLGMQLLLDESQEFGLSVGLGLIPGKVTALPNYDGSGTALKIPNIGWSSIHSSSGIFCSEGSILTGIDSGDSFYFAHSFMAKVTESKHNIAHCLYGGHKISALIQREHILGCQFHPEKSGKSGLKILKNFISL